MSRVICELRIARPMDPLAVGFKEGLIGLEQAATILHEKGFVGHFDLCDTAFLTVLNGSGNDSAGVGIASFVNGDVKGFIIDLAKVFDLLHMSVHRLRLGIRLLLCPCRHDLESSLDLHQHVDKSRRLTPYGPRGHAAHGYVCFPCLCSRLGDFPKTPRSQADYL